MCCEVKLVGGGASQILEFADPLQLVSDTLGDVDVVIGIGIGLISWSYSLRVVHSMTTVFFKLTVMPTLHNVSLVH